MAGKYSDEGDSDDEKMDCPWADPSVCGPAKPLKRMHWHVFKHHEEHYEDFANDYPFDKAAEPEIPSLNGKFKCIHCGYRGGQAWRMGLHHLLYHNIAAAQSWKTTGKANEPIPPKATPKATSKTTSKTTPRAAPKASAALPATPTAVKGKAKANSKETIEQRVLRHGKEQRYGSPPWLADQIKQVTRLVVDEIVEQALGLSISEVNTYTDEFCRVFRDNGSFERVTLEQAREGSEPVLREIEYTEAVYTAFKKASFNEDSEEPDDLVQGSKAWSMSDVFMLGVAFANGLSPEGAERYFKHIPRNERPKMGRLMPSLGDAVKTKLSDEVVESLIHRQEEQPSGDNRAKATPARISARRKEKGKGVVSSDSGDEHEQPKPPSFKSLTPGKEGAASVSKSTPDVKTTKSKAKGRGLELDEELEEEEEEEARKKPQTLRSIFGDGKN